MFTIGALSKLTKVKIPTIRYYEDTGLLDPPERSEGNQRRYSALSAERLSFIKHARDLGFSIKAIASLIDLQKQPDQSCLDATDIVTTQLSDVRQKIKKLQALEKELDRIAEACDGQGTSQHCYILASLADHSLCRHEH